MISKDKWIQSQINKYSDPKKGFGESDTIVKLKLKAYIKVINLVKPQLTFLDLGCNSGAVAYEAKKRGAIELAIDLPEVVKKIKYDINKKAMNLENEFPEGQWDIVWCREVIEHLRNPHEVIKKIVNSLSNNGTGIITAPNNVMDGPKNCPQHSRIYKNKELDKLIEKFGQGKIIETFNERRQRCIVFKRRS